MTGLLGRVVSAAQVRDAVRTTLQTWLPAMLADVADQEQCSPLAPIRSWDHAADVRRLTPDQLPSLIVGCGGTSGRKLRAGGIVDLTWTVDVATVVRGQSYGDTSDLAARYTAAAAQVLVVVVPQHPLIVEVRIPDTGGETFEVADIGSARTLAVGIATVEVTVDGARTLQPPSAASPSGMPTVPTVQQTEVEVVVDESP